MNYMIYLLFCSVSIALCLSIPHPTLKLFRYISRFSVSFSQFKFKVFFMCKLKMHINLMDGNPPGDNGIMWIFLFDSG